jgi:hypothetical protein
MTSTASITVTIHALDDFHPSKQQDVINVITRDVENLQAKLRYLGVSRTDICIQTILTHKSAINAEQKTDIPFMKTQHSPKHNLDDSTKMFNSPSTINESVELLLDDSVELLDPPSNCYYPTVKKLDHLSTKSNDSEKQDETFVVSQMKSDSFSPCLSTKQDTTGNESDPDIYALSYKELRKLCKERGLNQGGTKDTLIHRLIANSAAKDFTTPISALCSFTIQTLERRSNSSNVWNEKCCSANSEMVLSLYICQDGPGQAKYILGRCGCAKEVLKGWAVKSPSITGKLLRFWIADNNCKWKNYPCEFRAEFDTLEDAHDFMDKFENIVVQNAHIEEPSEDDDFIYQSQQQQM